MVHLVKDPALSLLWHGLNPLAWELSHAKGTDKKKTKTKTKTKKPKTLNSEILCDLWLMVSVDVGYERTVNKEELNIRRADYESQAHF